MRLYSEMRHHSGFTNSSFNHYYDPSQASITVPLCSLKTGMHRDVNQLTAAVSWDLYLCYLAAEFKLFPGPCGISFPYRVFLPPTSSSPVDVCSLTIPAQALFSWGSSPGACSSPTLTLSWFTPPPFAAVHSYSFTCVCTMHDACLHWHTAAWQSLLPFSPSLYSHP